MASSTKSFDDAIKVGIARAHKTLKNLKSAWVQNQQIKLDNEGKSQNTGVQLKVTFIIDD
ncbi:MAG: dodecin domain-containing protein [Anaerolineales bacterium]|nr:dodecin domain-containing protein [Anaerolineales bacterium]